jgi:hypothetical protein
MGGALYYFQDRSAIFLSVTEIAEIRDRENAERRLARAWTAIEAGWGGSARSGATMRTPTGSRRRKRPWSCRNPPVDPAESRFSAVLRHISTQFQDLSRVP